MRDTWLLARALELTTPNTTKQSRQLKYAIKIRCITKAIINLIHFFFNEVPPLNEIIILMTSWPAKIIKVLFAKEVRVTLLTICWIIFIVCKQGKISNKEKWRWQSVWCSGCTPLWFWSQLCFGSMISLSFSFSYHLSMRTPFVEFCYNKELSISYTSSLSALGSCPRHNSGDRCSCRFTARRLRV